MGYKEEGQLNAKRAARAALLSSLFDVWNVDSFLGKRALVLLGPDAGDVWTLLGFGCRDIVGFDIDRKCVEAAKRSFEGPSGGIEGLTFRVGSVPESLGSHERFDFIFLDFCGHVSRKMARGIWRTVTRHLVPNGVFAIGYQRGREKVDFGSKKRQLNRVMEHAPRYRDGEADRRMQALQLWIAEFSVANRQRWGARNLLTLNYQSTVPMSYTLMQKTESAAEVEIGGGLITDIDGCPTLFRSLVVQFAQGMGSLAASCVFNIPRTTISAWLAVASRDPDSVPLLDDDHIQKSHREFLQELKRETNLRIEK